MPHPLTARRAVARHEDGATSPNRIARSLWRCLAGAALAVTGIAVLAASPTPAGAAQPATTYTTAGQHIYTVPAGTTAPRVTLVGASASTVQHGSHPPGPAGLGAVIKAVIPVPKGTTTFYAEVGDNTGTAG